MIDEQDENRVAPLEGSHALKHDAIIEKWFEETMHNSAVSRNTEIYNHVRASVDDLKARIAKES